jgi:DNA-binding transcriptional LysR family regulator
MFESLSNFEMKVADMKGLKRGRLRLAVITTAKYMAPEMLGDFSKLYPGVELALKVTNRDSIIDRMHNNVDDLYIMGQVPEGELEVQSYSFAPNPLVLLAPREHPLVGKKNISLEEIAKEPFIVREPGSGMRDATFRGFDAKGLRPQVRMELGSNEAIKHAIVGGLGLSVMSLHTILLEGIDGPVAILDVEDFPIMRHWYMVYPKGKELSLVARTFLDFAIEYESIISKRMESIWPALKTQFDNNKKLKTTKKNAK